MRIASLWRYPVKSLGGERVVEVEVTRFGMVGDRRYGLLDVATGNVLTARREPRLLFATATWRATSVEDMEYGDVDLHLDDGRELRDDADLSDWLGKPVKLKLAGARGGTYENPADFEHETGWASWTGPAHAWHDSKRTRVSLVHRASLGDWDPRRFRANVLLEGEEAARSEDDLVGQTVRLGTCRLDVGKQIGRCVMVTRPQPGIDRDLDVLRAIHRDHGGNLAVGALVERGGRLAVGDELTPT